VFATALFVVFALAQGTSPVATVASVAALALATVIAVRCATSVARSHELTIGSRAHAHLEVLCTLPEPSHPTTAGRPRSRAPSAVVVAA